MSAAFRAPGVTAGGAAQYRTRQQQQRYPHADLKVFPGSVPVTKPPQCSRIMSKRTSDEAIKVDEFPVAATRRAALAAGVFLAVAEAGVGTPPAAGASPSLRGVGARSSMSMVSPRMHGNKIGRARLTGTRRNTRNIV